MGFLKVTISNTGEDAEKLSNTYTAGGNMKWYSHYGKQFSSFLEK